MLWLSARPVALRSSVTKASARRTAVRGLRRRAGCPATRDLAAGEGPDAEDALEQLGATGALQAGQPDDLAGVDGQVDGVDVPVAAAAELEAGLADRGALQLVGEEGGDGAPDHEPHDGGLVELARGAGVDERAVLEDGDRVAEVEDLLEPVGDVEDRDAAVGQPPDDGVEEPDLVVGQRGGGLVHRDDARVVADGLGDLDDLLLGDRQGADLVVGRQAADPEPVEELLGVAAHAGGVDERAAARLAAEVDVLGDGAVRQEVELLEDRGDAGGLGLHGVVEVVLLAGDLDGAAVGDVHPGQQLHQRGLAGAVLADEAVHLAGHEVEVGGLQDHVAEEGLGQPPGPQHGTGAPPGAGPARGLLGGVRRRLVGLVAICHDGTVACVTGFCRESGKSRLVSCRKGVGAWLDVRSCRPVTSSSCCATAVPGPAPSSPSRPGWPARRSRPGSTS